MDEQEIIALVIIALAGLYLIRTLFRKEGCSSGCDKCDCDVEVSSDRISLNVIAKQSVNERR